MCYPIARQNYFRLTLLYLRSGEAPAGALKKLAQVEALTCVIIMITTRKTGAPAPEGKCGDVNGEMRWEGWFYLVCQSCVNTPKKNSSTYHRSQRGTFAQTVRRLVVCEVLGMRTGQSSAAPVVIMGGSHA